MSVGINKRAISPMLQENGNCKKMKVETAEDIKPKEQGDNYDFLFNEEDDDFDLAAFEAAEKEASKESLDLSNWQRCRVLEIEREKKTFALILKVSAKVKQDAGEVEAEAKCYLQGPWCHTRVSVDDIVSIKAEFDSNLNAYKVDKDQGFCVVQPDSLICGTTVVGSLFCRRKAVLQDRFKGIDPNNKVMVVGSLVHELLQIVLEKKIIDIKAIEKEANDLLNSQDTAFMLYSSQLTREDTTLEVFQFVKSIHRFVQQYIDEKENSIPIEKDNFHDRISEIRDIEENLWIPQMGIKGKIDVSVRVQPRERRGQITKFTEKQEKILPLELKTGRATFSMEHKGQLILYQMMLTTLGKPTQSGLLLYLREGFLREIPGSRNEQRDLITLRNEISHYLNAMPDFENLPSDPKLEGDKFIQPIVLPDPISHPNACAQCAYVTLCCSFAKTDPSLELRANHPIRKLSEENLKHLTIKDFEYFIKWCHLLLMEENESRKSNFQRALWCHTPDEREQMGRAICGLEIADEGKAIKKEETRYLHRFVLGHKVNGGAKEVDDVVEEYKETDLMLYGFSAGEYVTVSTAKRLAIAAGSIIDMDSNSITVSLERNLTQNYANQEFIIDKYESQSGNVFNFTNLGILLDDTEQSALLRKIIVQLEQPTFVKVLPKNVSTEGGEILKQLNSVQRAAVLKALTTQSFMLIKGLPGTGKTQTLVAIIRLLYLMGKSIIITSHTHSAVDNLLLRLKPHKVPFLRLGNGARVNAQLRDSCESTLIADCHTEKELSKLYDSYRIVGVTCLGSSNAIFLHRRFDFCIVDEATQVMQPTVLRPLFFCDRFILVGDPEQLPPLVRSAEARKRGADESLFHRLDSKEATSVLTLQYRMNKTITKLANDLTYNGALECASNDIKMAKMSQSINVINTEEKWLQRVLQTHVDQSVFLIDTRDCSERSSQYAKAKHSSTCELIEKTFSEDSAVTPPEGTLKSDNSKTSKRLSKYSNYCEAAIVFHIVKTLLTNNYDPDRIGVIAPYRAQVELLRKLALQHHEFYEKQKPALNFSMVEVNTVDQYQGRDKDIIIYSCSRTGSSDSMNTERCRDAEILEDKRRLTVAITRSKHKLIIVGDSACIQQYTPFQTLLKRIPGFCKIQLENDKMGFHWDTVMDELTEVIKST
ncbi:DNA replication helicase/nuclease 2 [Musca autumnalis]|uniref:DNA replication helicase/nuclease 2 n=1 Tax=Musca autumnalis TaxID=221902 RepID=UPI003CF63CBA